MTQTCPACHRVVDDSSRFCTECGAPLGGEATPAPPDRPASPAPPEPPAVPPPPRAVPPVFSAAAGHGRPMPGYGGGAAVRKEAPALIPYHNKPALVGYYLAVFSLIPCLGLPLGVAAVVLGVLGLRKQREDPSVKGKGHAWVAIVLGGITTLLWGGLLAAGLFAAAQG